MFDYLPAIASPASPDDLTTPWSDSSRLLHDDNDETPRFENVIDNRREVCEARLLPGFYDIDPRRKQQVMQRRSVPFLSLLQYINYYYNINIVRMTC